MLSPEQLEIYSRQIALPEIGQEGQEKLAAAKVLLIGLGGGGSTASTYLAAAGIGAMGICDFDRVELSNLHRQLLYTRKDVGRFKVEAAIECLEKINPDMVLNPIPQKMTVEILSEIIGEYDFVVDDSDGLANRYMISDTCVKYGKPFVFGGCGLGLNGRVGTVLPSSPCVRCVYRVPESAQFKGVGGIIGPLPAIIGCAQAMEVIKYIIGSKDLLSNKVLKLNPWSWETETEPTHKRENCEICNL